MSVKRAAVERCGSTKVRALARALTRRGATWRLRRRAAASALDRHRRLIDGTVPRLGDATVRRATSAPVCCTAAELGVDAGQAPSSGDRTGTGRRRRTCTSRSSAGRREVVAADGCMATSIERPAIDLARALDFERRGRRARRRTCDLGATPRVMADILAQPRRRMASPTASAALEFADGRSGVGDRDRPMAELGCRADSPDVLDGPRRRRARAEQVCSAGDPAHAGDVAPARRDAGTRSSSRSASALAGDRGDAVRSPAYRSATADGTSREVGELPPTARQRPRPASEPGRVAGGRPMARTMPARPVP